jgi:hypothetical protein
MFRSCRFKNGPAAPIVCPTTTNRIAGTIGAVLATTRYSSVLLTLRDNHTGNRLSTRDRRIERVRNRDACSIIDIRRAA